MVTVAAWSRERTLNSVLNLGKLQLRLELMRQVYGDNCLSRAQIFRWYARFRSGVEKIEDEARPGRPYSVRNEELTAKVRKRIQVERCVTVRIVADEFGVNRETIRQILVEDLVKRKVVSGLCRMHCLMIKDTSVFSTQNTSLKLLVEIKISRIKL